MANTILAVLSMAMVTMFSFQQHRAILNARLTMIRAGLTLNAASVGTETLDEIGAKAFDQATLRGIVESPEYLTPIGVTPETPEYGSRNDIDDYAGLHAVETRVIGGKELAFAVEVNVDYISEADGYTVSTTPTKLKRAVTKVYYVNVANPDTVTLERLYMCGESCGW